MRRAGALLNSRPLLWAVLALPGIWMLARWALELSTYGELVSDSGFWAAELLILTMAVTPLRLLVGRGSWLVLLMRRRRDLGVASFAYAAAHTVIYLLRKQDLALILDEAGRPWLLAGWVALALFIPLAATSNDASMRLLRRWWKRLHRLVYAGAVLMFVHWALSAFDPTVAYLHIAVLAALEAARLGLQSRQRVT